MKYISTDCLKTQTIHLDDIVAIPQRMSKNSFVNHMKNGRNNNALVYYCSEGAQYILSDGTSFEPKAGEAVYIPAGCKYRLKINKDKCELFSIFFQMLDENNERSAFSDHIICTYAGNSQLSSIMLECIKLCDSTVVNRLLLSSNMYNVLHEFISCVENKKYPPPVEAALSYINNNLNTIISVKELASNCAMSESEFRSLFKESVGQSPLKYINAERMKKAILLLKVSDLPVSMISDMLGFYDDAYFYKIFKKTYNITPTEYRKVCTKKIAQK